MPETSRPGFREFLPSANQALAALEEASGKPVQIVEDPQLNVLATIRRAGAGEASHVLRIKKRVNQAADYLNMFECRMALRDGPGPRAVLRDNTAVREKVIRDCQGLHSQLPLEGLRGDRQPADRSGPGHRGCQRGADGPADHRWLGGGVGRRRLG